MDSTRGILGFASSPLARMLSHEMVLIGLSRLTLQRCFSVKSPWTRRASPGGAGGGTRRTGRGWRSLVLCFQQRGPLFAQL